MKSQSYKSVRERKGLTLGVRTWVSRPVMVDRKGLGQRKKRKAKEKLVARGKPYRHLLGLLGTPNERLTHW